MNDHITLREAMETDAWLMVFAGEPPRQIDVTMTYNDLYVIRKLVLENKTIKKLDEERKTLRNELCLHCGNYKQKHKGACDDCRWRDG